MRHRTFRKALIYSVMILFIFIFIAGCNKYQRYAVLTFFFTGVPHPDEEIVSEQIDEARPEAVRIARQQITSMAYSHGPFAANQCYLCHETSTTAALHKTDPSIKTEATSSQRFDAGLPGRLLSPLKELCVECHASKSVKVAYNKNLWIHGPVSEGICTVCHNPHSSQYPYMLLKGRSNQMCEACHAEGFITLIKDHVAGDECIKCHNAHLGKNRFLLKKDFEEAY